MKYLLDTAVWLWSLAGPGRINNQARKIIAEGQTDLYLSAASSWEISIKSALGELPLPEPPARYVPKRLAAQVFGSCRLLTPTPWLSRTFPFTIETLSIASQWHRHRLRT